jgi:hypothetical protein
MGEANGFYSYSRQILSLPSDERANALRQLQTEVVKNYCLAVQKLSAADVQRIGSDGRTVAQVIGHIAEWDRFTMLGLGEILSGVFKPNIIEDRGWLEFDGTAREFQSVDDFNAYQAERQANMPWEEIQTLAVRIAIALREIFANPLIVSPALLDNTIEHSFERQGLGSLTLPYGWYLWFLDIEHKAVAHGDEVGWIWQQ